MSENPNGELPAALEIVNDGIETAPAMTMDPLPPSAEPLSGIPPNSGLTDTQNDLYARAFGGGDDSDLSDDEEAVERPAGALAADEGDEDEEAAPLRPAPADEDDEDEDGDYGAEEVNQLPKIKKKKRTDVDNGGVEDEERRRKKKKRKESRRADRADGEEEEAGPVYDEATSERARTVSGQELMR